jgi:excisionase family DNA binding protein
MPKLPSPARIKRHHVYTIWEAATALGLCRHTVERWIKGGALVADTTRRPWLIEGAILKAFLAARRTSGKSKTKTGQIHCIPCRGPKTPALKMADFRVRTSCTGTLIGLCPDCGRLMHRFVRRSDLDLIKADLEVTLT